MSAKKRSVDDGSKDSDKKRTIVDVTNPDKYVALTERECTRLRKINQVVISHFT